MPKAANAQILDDLNNGASGITLVFQGAVGDYGYALPATGSAISTALDDVHLDAGVAVDLDLGLQSKDAAGLLATLVKAPRHRAEGRQHPLRLRSARRHCLGGVESASLERHRGAL